MANLDNVLELFRDEHKQAQLKVRKLTPPRFQEFPEIGLTRTRG
jgi:hypothetical protein